MSGLRAKVGYYPHTHALFGAPVDAGGTEITFDVTTPGSVARDMLRELAHEMCELPIINYFAARERGVPITALPIFLTRRFPQPTILTNAAAGIDSPKALEGRSVGSGYYGNSDTTWAQVMLDRQFGVDCDAITWVTSQEEQVAGVEVPANVRNLGRVAETRATDGLPAPMLDAMLVSGELAAVVYALAPSPPLGPEVVPLLVDPEDAARTWFADTGVFPILHTFVVRNDVLDAHRGLGPALYKAFVAAKADAYRRREKDEPLTAELVVNAHKSGFPVGTGISYLGDDPIPYGVDANRANLELLTTVAFERHCLATPVDLDGAFLAVGA